MTIQNLGPYEIQSEIGRGGMGTVYVGIEKQSGRKVAVKVLSPTLWADDAFRSRFVAEVQSLERLRHPHVVELYGYGEEDGQLFYAMELVDGTSLQEELSAGRRFEWREVVKYGIEICSALKHAHDFGIIHRDIKPANLLIDQHDHVRLTDFGIAKLFGNSQHTAVGGILGTADYMSPEQAEGLAVTPKCDLYSVGAVLYALLAGRAPFQGKSLPEVVHQVRFEPPLPVRRFAAETPEELERLVDQLLAKSPASRVPTALALSKRLQAIQSALSVQPDMEATLVSPPPTGGASDDVARPVAADAQGGSADDDDITSVPLEVRDGSGSQRDAAVRSSLRGRDGTSDVVSDLSQTHFTTVDEDYRRRLAREEKNRESRLESWSKWIGLVAMISLVGGLLWYFSQEPTAEELLREIRAAAMGSEDQLVLAETQMREFVDRFPDDPQRSEVDRHLQEIALMRFGKRLERLSRRRTSSDELSALERLLLAAKHIEPINPHRSAARLQALLDVYGGHSELDARDRQCVELARQWLEQLRESLQDSTLAEQAFVEQRIRDAKSLATADRAKARAILLGVIELYSEYPWAKPLVDEARRAASRIEEP